MTRAASSISTTTPGESTGTARSSSRCSRSAGPFRQYAAASRRTCAAEGSCASVSSLAIRLLDLGFFRIGSERYAEENETHGLATLKRRHVSLERGKAVFDYRAKGSQRHVQVVADP